MVLAYRTRANPGPLRRPGDQPRADRRRDRVAPQALGDAPPKLRPGPVFCPARAVLSGPPRGRMDGLGRSLRPRDGAPLGAFGIGTPLVPSSALDVGGAKSELVLNLCRAVG